MTNSGGRLMRVQLFGPVRVWVADREVGLGSAQQRGVLALLALAGGKPVPRHQLVAAVWGQDPPATASNVIQVHVSQLRRALEPGRLSRRPSDLLPTVGAGYALRVDPEDVDALRFRRLLAAAAALRRTGDDGGVVSLLGEVLNGWQTPFADASFFSDQAAATLLIEERWQAVGWYADAAMACGMAADVLAMVQDCVTHRPLDEPAQARLIRAYCALGRRADAFEVFRRTRMRLSEELGVDPGPDLTAAYAMVLADPPDPVEGTGHQADAPTPAQLPPRTALFTGRGEELSALRDWLRRDGLQTSIVGLEGTAGVGKTAIAVELAHSVAHQFHDGQIYLDMRGHDEATAVAPRDALVHMLRSLGADESRLPSDVDQLSAHYRSIVAARRLLMIFDNAAGTDQVLGLLPASPSCAVIITSRRALPALATHQTVHRVTVDVLPVAESLRLMGNIAGADRIAREPAAATRLRELCGDLPLALCLAAARLCDGQSMSLSSLVAELADEQQRLAGLAVEDGTRSVRGAFGWSYRGLPAPMARAFRLMSLHPGTSFSTDLVATTTGHTRDATRRIVERLTTAHLMIAQGGDRYRFHDLIRLFAAEMLDRDSAAEERLQAERMLLDWYATIVDATCHLITPLRDAMRVRNPRHPLPFRPEPRDALDYLAREADNFTSVVRYGAINGYPHMAAQLTYLLFSFYVSRSRALDFVECSRWGLVAATALGDERTQAHMLNVAGVAANLAHALDRAVEFHDKQIAAWHRLGDQAHEATAWNNLGGAYTWLNRHVEALDAFQRALVLWEAAGETVRCGIALDNIGDTARDLGDLELSAGSLLRALTMWQETDNEQGQGQALFGLGKTRYFAGEPDVALDLFQRAYSIQQRIGDHRMGALAVLWMGKVHLERASPEALPHLHQSHSMAAEMADSHTQATAGTTIATAHIRRGDMESARKWLDQSQKLLADHPDPLEEGLLHHAHTELARRLNDPAAAEHHERLARQSYADAGCIESRMMLTRLSNGR